MISHKLFTASLESIFGKMNLELIGVLNREYTNQLQVLLVTCKSVPPAA